MHSCLYEGWLRHRRFAPLSHAFRYGVYMAFIDLSEIDELLRTRRILGASRYAPIAFRRRDYIGDADVPLDRAVRARVAQHTGAMPSGPIRLLTHLAHFGYCFNPVSFYYCFDARGERVETVLAQITNTPWGERHEYVLRRTDEEGRIRERFEKRFHVSPFMAMDMEYEWRVSAPNRTLAIHMDVGSSSGPKTFDATLVLVRRPITDANLARMLALRPLMTARVIGAIYWQALRLYLKGAPFHPHPRTRPRGIAA
jgi:DUF1365 family protein